MMNSIPFSPARLGRHTLRNRTVLGQPFIANPDLPARIAKGWPLNQLHPETLYGGSEEGLTDYPAYSERPAHLIVA